MKIYNMNFDNFAIGKTTDGQKINFKAGDYNSTLQNFFVYIGKDIDFGTTMRLTMENDSNKLTLFSIVTPVYLRKNGYGHAVMSCLDSAVKYINGEIKKAGEKKCLINVVELEVALVDENNEDAKTIEELYDFYSEFGFVRTNGNGMKRNMTQLTSSNTPVSDIP